MEYWTVDVLLNNAGYALFGPLELSTEDQIRRAYDTLLLGDDPGNPSVYPHVTREWQW
ncbi:hypothetical protein N219_06990 [Limosilactobacillus fermentum MTCC 8711]|nr:hypothetical protein N219_06990 [Limosilactobacillus fermentum MTCC 8711]